VLQRIGKLTDIPMRPIIPSPLSYRYRNRITVHVEEGVIGFFRRDSHRLIDIEQCPIAQDEVNHALAALRASRPREGHYTLRAALGPRVFTQANDAVAGSLRELLGQLIPPGQDLLIDAYCGAGFFAQALLDKFEQIIGIDWDRFAIEAAKQTASSKETYIAGDVDMELNRALEQSHGRKTVVIVDPPATGLTGNVRDALVRAAPATLLYVSCNPPTLARDVKDLRQRYTVESVTPLDMFPQTAEIEVAVQLQATA
jgi:23S rRNA (uracil1939-C5)-methyltransferase